MPYRLNTKQNGTGPIIVLVHGVAGSLAIWDPIVQILETNFRVVRVDLLGYGFSPKPKINYSPDDHIDSIKSSLLNIGINEPFNIVGLSMGSLLALNYSIKYPNDVKKIVGIGTLFYKDKEQAKKLATNNFWLKIAVGPKLIGYLIISISWFLGRHIKLVRTLFATKLYTDKMAKESLMNRYHPFRYSVINCILNNLIIPLLDQLTNKEILLIHGTLDTWAPIDNLQSEAQSRPNLKLRILDGVSHNTVVIDPVSTAKNITDFLL